MGPINKFPFYLLNLIPNYHYNINSPTLCSISYLLQSQYNIPTERCLDKDTTTHRRPRHITTTIIIHHHRHLMFITTIHHRHLLTNIIHTVTINLVL
ncbi:hypothetical protein HanIR_Chr13g0636911 [Helianthus annuus]|nr:hypothetical protein HanIR_Chr13g0636911 [Helianthus annuus]